MFGVISKSLVFVCLVCFCMFDVCMCGVWSGACRWEPGRWVQPWLNSGRRRACTRCCRFHAQRLFHNDNLTPALHTHKDTHTHIHTLSSNVHPCVCLRTVHTFMHTVLTHKHICTHSVYSLFMRKDLSTQMSLSLIIHTAHSLIHSDFSVCINYSLYSHMLLC